LNFEF